MEWSLIWISWNEVKIAFRIVTAVVLDWFYIPWCTFQAIYCAVLAGKKFIYLYWTYIHDREIPVVAGILPINNHLFRLIVPVSTALFLIHPRPPACHFIGDRKNHNCCSRSKIFLAHLWVQVSTRWNFTTYFFFPTARLWHFRECQDTARSQYNYTFLT